MSLSKRFAILTYSVLRWYKQILLVPGMALLAAILALGGGSELLIWSIEGVFRGWWHIVALLVLYGVPGLALLHLLWPDEKPLPLAAYVTLAIGLSIALPPLLLLLFQQLYLPWNQITTWGYIVLSLIITLRSLIKGTYLHTSFPVRIQSSDIVLLGITIVALLVQLYIVRDLPTGLFGDSYHHTMVTQLLVDNQGIFQSWRPYAPLASFTYHFGFHANAAFVHWITGRDVIQSVVLIGQILNALSAPMAFLLVVALGGSPRVGIWAALMTGFVSTIPSFYVNWGRYTQLTGHIVFVVAAVCWILLIEDGHAKFRQATWSGWKPLVLVTLVTAAMPLTHYLVTIMATLCIGSYLLALVLTRRSWKFVLTLIWHMGIIAFFALLLTTPWILNLLNGYLIRNATGLINPNGQEEIARVAQYATLPATVPLYAKSYVLVGAFLGLCVAAWQRQWQMAMLGLWTILLALCVVPHVVGLPGDGIIDHLTGLGAWYLTIVPLAGYAMATIQEGMEHGMLMVANRFCSPTDVVGKPHTKICMGVPLAHPQGLALPNPYKLGGANNILMVTALRGCFGLLLLVVMVWGMKWQMHVIDGTTQMVTHADMDAMAWIQTHTPEHARFLVNTFPAYGGNLVAGTDAGWWIPLLTGRQTNLPPITYGSERGERDTYWMEVNHLSAQLRQLPLKNGGVVRVDLTTPQALEALHNANITYVYRGAHATPDHNGADYIDTSLLHASQAFRLVYAKEGVEIFQLGDKN